MKYFNMIKSKTIRKERFRIWKVRFKFKIKSIWQIVRHDRFHLIVFKPDTGDIGFLDSYDFNLLGVNQRKALIEVATIFVQENMSAEKKMDKVFEEAEKLINA